MSVYDAQYFVPIKKACLLLCARVLIFKGGARKILPLSTFLKKTKGHGRFIKRSIMIQADRGRKNGKEMAEGGVRQSFWIFSGSYYSYTNRSPSFWDPLVWSTTTWFTWPMSNPESRWGALLRSMNITTPLKHESLKCFLLRVDWILSEESIHGLRSIAFVPSNFLSIKASTLNPRYFEGFKNWIHTWNMCPSIQMPVKCMFLN